LCDKVCQWLTAGLWFSPDTPVSYTNKTDCHNIAEILLKVVLYTQALTRCLFVFYTETKYNNPNPSKSSYIVDSLNSFHAAFMCHLQNREESFLPASCICITLYYQSATLKWNCWNQPSCDKWQYCMIGTPPTPLQNESDYFLIWHAWMPSTKMNISIFFYPFQMSYVPFIYLPYKIWMPVLCEQNSFFRLS
jgi:hypothetical protein